MSISSSDIFEDIEQLACVAKEESRKGNFYTARTRLNIIKTYLKSVEQKLDYEDKCKKKSLRIGEY